MKFLNKYRILIALYVVLAGSNAHAETLRVKLYKTKVLRNENYLCLSPAPEKSIKFKIKNKNNKFKSGKSVFSIKKKGQKISRITEKQTYCKFTYKVI